MERKTLIAIAIIVIVTVASVASYSLLYQSPTIITTSSVTSESVTQIVTSQIADTIIIGISATPRTLSPYLAASRTSAYIRMASQEGLYRFLPGTTTVVPLLATGMPDYSADHLTWTINLRQGVRYTDGTPFNSQVVKWDLERYANTTCCSASDGAFQIVPFLKEVEVVNDYQVKLHLKRPFLGFLGYLASMTGAFVSPQAVQKLGDQQGALYGTGPYAVTYFDPNEKVVMVRNENYWNQSALPKTKTLIWTIFKDASSLAIAVSKGDVDIAFYNIYARDAESILQNNPNLKGERLKTTWDMQLYFSFNYAPFKDVNVRRAVAYALDVNAIINTVYGGKAERVFSSIPEVYPEYYAWGAKYGHDVSQARTLLAQAGYPNGFPVKLYYTPTFYTPELPDVVALVQSQLAEVGIQVTPVAQELLTFITDRRSGTHQLDFGVTTATVPNADYLLRIYYYTHALDPGNLNIMNYTNPNFDALLDKGAAEFDPALRAQDYIQAQKLLENDLPGIPMFRAPQYIIMQKSVQGFVVGAVYWAANLPNLVKLKPPA